MAHSDLAAKYMLKGINFAGCGADFTAQDIKLSNGTGPACGSSGWKSVAPQLMFRDSVGIYSTTYYFVEDAIPVPGQKNVYLPGWVDAKGYDVHDKIDIGQGFWIYDNYNAEPTYTLAGQVLDKAFETDYNVGYTLAANPFPMALNPNDATKIDWGTLDGPICGSSGWKNLAPQIMIRDDKGIYSTTYYFVHDGIPVPGTKDYTPGWVDAKGYDIQEAGIPAGAGFWYLNNDAKIKVTFKNPL